jgi:hypothetical protein
MISTIIILTQLVNSEPKSYSRLSLTKFLSRDRGDIRNAIIPIFDGYRSFKGAKSEKVLAEYIRKGSQLIGYLDCFQWFDSSSDPELRSMMASRLSEVGKPRVQFDYVSPFSSQVQSVLLSHIQSNGAAYALLDKIILNFQLPYSPHLMCGDPERKQYLRLTKIDPIDIKFYEEAGVSAVPSNDIAENYLKWRIEYSRQFLSMVCLQLKKVAPKIQIYIRCNPRWTRESLLTRAAQLADWPFALDSKIADGISLKYDGPNDDAGIEFLTDSLHISGWKPKVIMEVQRLDDSALNKQMMLSNVATSVSTFRTIVE